MADNVWLWAVGSVSIISALSLTGVVALPIRKRATLDSIVFFLVSLATGAMLGNALFNLIPESFEHSSDKFVTSALIASGVLIYFVCAKILNLRCHHVTGGHCHEEHYDAHPTVGGHIHITGWMSLLSHAMDNFTDGIGIGASYLLNFQAGVNTTISVVLHEVAHEFGAFGVQVNAGFSRWAAIFNNFLSALIATTGCVLVLLFGTWMQGLSEKLTPVCAGIFLSIAMSGLIPQLQKETDTRRSLWQVSVMLVGLASIAAVRLWFPE